MVFLGVALSWVLNIALGGVEHFAAGFFYIPIILAAARLGPRAAFLTGAVCTLVAGPFLPDDVAQRTTQATSVWISRGVFFMVLGYFFGRVFDHLKTTFERDLELLEAERDKALWEMNRRTELERQLRESEERYRAAFSYACTGNVLAELDGSFIQVNQTLCTMLGLSDEELSSLSLKEIIHNGDRTIIAEAIGRLRSGALQNVQIESRYRQKDGFEVWAEFNLGLIRDDSDKPLYLMAQIQDISKRKQAEEANRQLAVIMESSSDAVMGMTLDGIITSWNASAEKIYGYAAEEIIGQDAAILVPADRVAERKALLEQLPQGVAVKHFETERLAKDGRRIDLSLSIAPIRDANGSVTAYAVTAHEIGERKAFEQWLKHQALHDPLTGLPNRVQLKERLERSQVSARRETDSMAILLLDLDRFKEVNDTHGHYVGDALLQEIALRLQRVMRKTDFVARLGGDEFAIVLSTVTAASALHVGEAIHAALSEPLFLQGRQVHVVPSIGIALYPEHGTDGETLLRRADAAMYAAKRSGKTQCLYAEDSITAGRLQRR